jgi:hypothetical protein
MDSFRVSREEDAVKAGASGPERSLPLTAPQRTRPASMARHSYLSAVIGSIVVARRAGT